MGPGIRLRRRRRQRRWRARGDDFTCLLHRRRRRRHRLRCPSFSMATVAARRRSDHRMIEPIIFRQRGRRARSPARHPNARLPACGARTPIVNQTGRLHMIAFFDLAANQFQKPVSLDGGRPVDKFDDAMIWIKASLEFQERRLTPPLWRDQLSPKFHIMMRKGAPQMCTNTIVKLLIHSSFSSPFAPSKVETTRHARSRARCRTT